jgi:predicted ATPase
MARQHPIVALIEDVHWAEPALVDLLDHLARLADGPMLVLCTARPEVTERRPGWPPEPCVVVRLEPLEDAEVERLVAQTLGTADLEPMVRSKVVRSADGNPLFVEQLLSMLIDEGALARDDDRWVSRRDLTALRVPATITALLEARLDQLDPMERSTLERAAVAGRVFSRGSVAALLPDDVRPRAGAVMESLQRKEFVRPDPSSVFGEEALAFRHALIRDAANAGIPKRTRAELHERFAD